MYETIEKPARPDPGMHTFRITLHGLWNGFILETGHQHLNTQKSFAIQLKGDSERDFETVIRAIRAAYAAHIKERP